MQEKEIVKVLGNGVSPYSFIHAIMADLAYRDSQLTTEERAERKEKRRLLEEERIRHAKIIKNICPDCGGKLVRGKKDKKNNYKRLWTCKDCGSSHSA